MSEVRTVNVTICPELQSLFILIKFNAYSHGVDMAKVKEEVLEDARRQDQEMLLIALMANSNLIEEKE